MKFSIADIKLADYGQKRIEWAANDMPVLEIIKNEFTKTKPFRGRKMAACLHVTAETANLMRTLKAGGADIVLVASNPLSTQDDVAAALVKHYQIPVLAIKGEDHKTYYDHLRQALEHQPEITMDDGADLINLLHTKYLPWASHIIGSLEETTTGVNRLRALEQSGQLRVPIIAVNDAKTKNLFDNRYGTGQSTIDGIIRATDILLAGKTMVVAGYGWCGRGLALRARGMGAQVIVTEIDEIKALEAAMDGFAVMPMKAAAKIGDLFCTVTGNRHVLDAEHFKLMKDGAIICNSGHFDVEINVPALAKLASRVRRGVRNYVDEYLIKGKRINLLAGGRLINLAAAEGHPASVMDMSFATQALAAADVVKNYQNLKSQVYPVAEKIEQKVAQLKLKSMNITIDNLTAEQKKYLESWEMGT